MEATPLIDRLEGVRPNGSGYMARCPAHADTTASLSITETDDRLLLNCFAGCETRTILESLNWRYTDLFAKSLNGDRPLDEYEYRDREGRLVYVVERMPGKGFRQRRIMPDGTFEWGLSGAPRLLYHLPQLKRGMAADRLVFVVEGEKDVHTLEGHGLVATCCSGGSGAWRLDHARELSGARLAVLPDNDEPGRKYAHTVAETASEIAKRIKVVYLPGLDLAEDVTDWLRDQHTLAELKELVTRAPLWSPSGPARTLSQHAGRAIEWLWQDRIPARKLSIVAGLEGSGKSYLTLALASMWTGASLFITYEDDPADTIRPRAELMGADLDRIHVWDARLDPFEIPADMDRLRTYLRQHPDIRTIVVDPLPGCLGGVDYYRATDVRRAIGQLMRLDRSLIGVMHLTKGEREHLVHRVAGSQAFTALARSVLLVQRQEVSVIKSNVAAAYRVPRVSFRIGDRGLVLGTEGAPLDAPPETAQVC